MELYSPWVSSDFWLDFDLMFEACSSLYVFKWYRMTALRYFNTTPVTNYKPEAYSSQQHTTCVTVGSVVKMQRVKRGQTHVCVLSAPWQGKCLETTCADILSHSRIIVTWRDRSDCQTFLNTGQAVTTHMLYHKWCSSYNCIIIASIMLKH